mgnify:FL=1
MVAGLGVVFVVKFVFKSACGREEWKSEKRDREWRIFQVEGGVMTAIVLESIECEIRGGIIRDRSWRAARDSDPANLQQPMFIRISSSELRLS